jgi:Uncharacterized protein involved in cytokinesis, contains TGc (transglutaminase/protease-like) domain
MKAESQCRPSHTALRFGFVNQYNMKGPEKMRKRKFALSLRTLLTAALLTALLTASAMFVNASAENSDPAEGITANESFTVENELSLGIQTRISSRLYANASPAAYVSSYGAELTEGSVAQKVYNGFYGNFVTTPGNSPFTVNFDPAVRVKGVDNGNVNAQGEKVIDIDAADQAFINFNKSVNLGAVAFAYDHPEVFWIRNHSYNFSSAPVIDNDDDSYAIDISAITITADEAYSGAYSQRDTVNNGITAACSAIQSGNTRYDTLKNIHDYICTNATYDYAAAGQNQATKAHTAAPFFIANDGKVVCEGYSKALKILCDKFGIPCALVCGDAKTENGKEAHMWTYVKMDDGLWYAVDVTWDDQNSGIITRYFLKGSNTMISDHEPSPPSVNNEEVPICYPVLETNDYDPDANQGTTPTNPSTSQPSISDPSISDPSISDPSISEPSTSEPSASQPSTSESSSETSATETTTTQAQPKQITLRLDDPDNGFVKSAEIPETAQAKAGNDDVELNNIKIVVTKLNDTEKKALSDGIRRINNSYDPDNSILEAFDIQLKDNKDRTVMITEGKVKICVAFSSAQTNRYTNYVYSVYHQNGNAVERVKPVTYNAQGVWFESDSFSPFGVVSVKSTGDKPSPETGETILMTVIAVIMLALAACAIAFVIIRNRASSDNAETAATENTDSEKPDTPEEKTSEEGEQNRE